MKINNFKNEYSWLSNFYNSPISDSDGIIYPTVEHYFQAMKTTNKKERLNIANCATPGLAKSYGRKVNLRSDWEEIKEKIMYEALYKKFQNPELRQKLLATKDVYLEEGNNWKDTYWGVCNGIGKNRLGHLLMKIREEILY